MKLAPALHAGGLKKALALAGLGAASAGAAYKGGHDPTGDAAVAAIGAAATGAMHRDAGTQVRARGAWKGAGARPLDLFFDHFLINFHA